MEGTPPDHGDVVASVVAALGGDSDLPEAPTFAGGAQPGGVVTYAFALDGNNRSRIASAGRSMSFAMTTPRTMDAPM